MFALIWGKCVLMYFRKMFTLLVEKCLFLFEENIYSYLRKMFTLIWGNWLFLFEDNVQMFSHKHDPPIWHITPSLSKIVLIFLFFVTEHVQSSCIKGGFLKSWLGFVLVQLYINFNCICSFHESSGSGAYPENSWKYDFVEASGHKSRDFLDFRFLP